MARTITRYNGKFEKEQVDMEEAKDMNKALGLPDIDPEDGSDEEPEDVKVKKTETKKRVKKESKRKKEEFPPADDDEEDEDDEEETESRKAKKESRRYKYIERGEIKTEDEEDDEEDVEDDEEDSEEEPEESKKSRFKKETRRKRVKESKRSRKEEDDEEGDEEEGEDDEEETESKGSRIPSKEFRKETKRTRRARKENDHEDGEEDEDDEEEMESKKSKKEHLDIDVSEDVSALIDGEELSDEFKNKASTIFEAAVKSKISKIRKQVRSESKKEMDDRQITMQTEMNDKVDEYLNYVVKEWMEENKLAVEQGVRNEVTESFISGLKKLFEEHYIDIPEEKEDVFESLVQEVAELETKLDEQTQKHMDTVKDLNEYKAKDIFRDITEGMVDTDVEKMSELTEDVDYESDEQYKEKLNIIKNSYFKKDKKLEDNKGTAATNKNVTDGSGDGRMDSVMAAISSLKK